MQKHTKRLSSAKVRLKYAAEYATLFRQEAELKASKLMLTTKREAEEANCNLEA